MSLKLSFDATKCLAALASYGSLGSGGHRRDWAEIRADLGVGTGDQASLRMSEHTVAPEAEETCGWYTLHLTVVAATLCILQGQLSRTHQRYVAAGGREVYDFTVHCHSIQYKLYMHRV